MHIFAQKLSKVRKYIAHQKKPFQQAFTTKAYADRLNKHINLTARQSCSSMVEVMCNIAIPGEARRLLSSLKKGGWLHWKREICLAFPGHCTYSFFVCICSLVGFQSFHKILRFSLSFCVAFSFSQAQMPKTVKLHPRLEAWYNKVLAARQIKAWR